MNAKRKTSRAIIAVAFGEGQVLLCEDSVALDFVQESGGPLGEGGAFVPEDSGVDVQVAKHAPPGVYVGELRVVDGGAESWEMPHIRDYYAEIRNLRPVTEDEWKSHLHGEWPEEWNG